MASEEHIASFIMANRADTDSAVKYLLQSVTVPELLSRENPYVLMRRGDGRADSLIRSLLEKQIGQWETRGVDDLLESLAIHVAKTAYGGWKSERAGVSLEFVNGNAWYVIALIPYPRYDEGNEILEIADCLNDAAKSIKRNNPSADVLPVIGCSFGRESVTDREDYLKYCGQEFWELISGCSELFARISELLGKMSARAETRTTDEYARTVNRLSAEFYRRFCDESGAIDWGKLTAEPA